MKLLRRLKSAGGRVGIDLDYWLSKRRMGKYSQRLKVAEIAVRFPTADEQWAYCHHFFWHLAPQWLRDHRAFFAAEQRGFGEDATHGMWYLLLTEFRPANFLEIGVYRGQVLSLVKLIAQYEEFPCSVLGISPLTSEGDSVTRYRDFDYEADIRANLDHIGTPLRAGELLRGLSTDANARAAIRSRKWDIGYIDGNHDYPVARHDFELVASSLSSRGLVVLDDAGLYSGYHPRSFSFAGHPGPSRVLREARETGWDLIFQAGHNAVIRRRT
jgi:hypothetical protein